MADKSAPGKAGFIKNFCKQLKKELTEGPPHVLAICHVGLIACPIMIIFAISMAFSPGTDRANYGNSQHRLIKTHAFY